MKWYHPIYGDTKMRSWFALLPVTIGNETRWMENVTVMYKYSIVAKGKWEAMYFVDN